MSTSIVPFYERHLVKLFPLKEDEKRQPSYGSMLVVARRDCQDDDEESTLSSRALAWYMMERERPSDQNPRYTAIFVMTLVAIAYAILFYGAIRGEGALSFGTGGSENRQAASVIVSVMQQVHQQP
jgi:hypothetical protein